MLNDSGGKLETGRPYRQAFVFQSQAKSRMGEFRRDWKKNQRSKQRMTTREWREIGPRSNSTTSLLLHELNQAWQFNGCKHMYASQGTEAKWVRRGRLGDLNALNKIMDPTISPSTQSY